ncbi:MAG: hypothetical protein ABW002_16625 [Xanthomonas sp.]
MPHDVPPALALSALNATLTQLHPPGTALATLTSPAVSDPAWSCKTFAPLMLEMVLLRRDRPLRTTPYLADAALPTFADGDFVNIVLLGDPSQLIHNVNVLVAGDRVYLFQAYLEQVVDVVRVFESTTFYTLWHDLCAGRAGLWKHAYQALFGVDPNQVVDTDPDTAWFQSQYVSL